MINRHRISSFHGLEDSDDVTRHLCANLDALDSSQWTFFTRFALDWIARQERSIGFYTDSGVALHDCPPLDHLHRASVDDTPNGEIIEWMQTFLESPDPVGVMADVVFQTDGLHPFPSLRADAHELHTLSRRRDLPSNNALGMVHYRLTKMLLRLAITVRNLGCLRLESPDYLLSLRV